MKAFREIACFQSARQDLIIWTIESLQQPREFKTLVSFPKNDSEGYQTVAKCLTEEEAMKNHLKWLKRLAFRNTLR